jgi:hypothetical protein
MDSRNYFPMEGLNVEKKSFLGIASVNVIAYAGS